MNDRQAKDVPRSHERGTETGTAAQSAHASEVTSVCVKDVVHGHSKVQQAPEVMTANSFLGGVPATVVCGNQVQVPSCKCPS